MDKVDISSSWRYDLSVHQMRDDPLRGLRACSANSGAMITLACAKKCLIEQFLPNAVEAGRSEWICRLGLQIRTRSSPTSNAQAASAFVHLITGSEALAYGVRAYRGGSYWIGWLDFSSILQYEFEISTVRYAIDNNLFVQPNSFSDDGRSEKPVQVRQTEGFVLA